MPEMTIKQRMERYHAAYRFIRRYLQEFNPDIYNIVNCEGLTAIQIDEKGKKLIPNKYE